MNTASTLKSPVSVLIAGIRDAGPCPPGHVDYLSKAQMAALAARCVPLIEELEAQRDEWLAARANRLDQERRYLASFHGADKVSGTATLLKAWIAEDEAAIAKAEDKR